MNETIQEMNLTVKEVAIGICKTIEVIQEMIKGF